MNISRLKALLGATALTIVAAGAAQAGGFSRGTADTDILFEEGNAARAGVTVVAPNRTRDSYSGGIPASGFENPTYVIPSVAAKYKVNDAFACALTYTTPFGGHSDYTGLRINGALVGFDPTSLTGSSEQEFLTHEFGGTCSYGVDVGKGRFSLLGGLFYQSLDFEQWVGGPTRPLKFSLQDGQVGYRVGAAYEIKEIALRAQVMYRSATDIDATGDLSFTSNGAVLGPATGWGKFPQSFEAKVQSGIAPGWLAYGSVKWTDWSVMDVINYKTPLSPANQTLNFFWQDGWTVTGGVAHAFTESFAGTASVTWDRGVGTGHDISTDTWTFGIGGSYKPNSNVEIRGGLGLLYIAAGSQDFRQVGPGTDVPSPGIYTAESDIGYAGSLSLAVKW
ncbi:outer membrane protein transport protein [Aminobacter sp. MDW-2]|uniref:OmpP1/FadL family transporter n=1 Tax=Aminobacter sp. MDW-2 TaxID=2666139 RepID=UPI0012AF2826|nr:outer membrane protein transport protein [Aminobacter sp. MDW-2]MRX31825.1 aromatic hydrocarbon degradation protein [Aminobacter sp. MDW-2]QNH32302.1 aromatic hydrocarbon degradation protein [Aminobacter sp. MDW-2]